MLQTVLAVVLFAGVMSQVQPSNPAATYDQYQKNGNRSAKAGEFDAAISAWTKAEALSPIPGNCKGEYQRVQIQTAKDAKLQMTQVGLNKSQAAAWYEQHQVQRWAHDKCNHP